MSDKTLATLVLDLLQEIMNEKADTGITEIHFEELTAEPGPLPRVMLSLREGAKEERYISGETLVSFPFALTLRIQARAEQDRLDAEEYLRGLTQEFLSRCMVLESFIAYKKPSSSMVTCLGRTSSFEDWQVTFDLKYKQRK